MIVFQHLTRVPDSGMTFSNRRNCASTLHEVWKTQNTFFTENAFSLIGTEQKVLDSKENVTKLVSVKHAVSTARAQFFNPHK